ncbi:MAG: FKBP-type peptidyl-prolyl cis-trans isomerase [Crocinitomicaceae bacterium]
MIKHFFYCSLFIGLFSCNLEGVEDVSNEEGDTLGSEIIKNTADSLEQEDPTQVKPDSINGIPNDMVFQRKDGLRIEWEVKKEEHPIELNDVIMVNYHARVAAGEEYDSNESLGKPVPLKTNINMLIQGWEEGLLYMHEGDKGRIMIPAALAYGEIGYKTIVPPDADIIVDIEIVSIVDPILLEDGVKVYKWQQVNGGETPKKNQLITFDYFAYKKGKKAGLYDNSYKNGSPFSFKFENDNVVDGLHIGMSVMKAGENAFIEIPAEAAYGSKGMLDLVPKNTAIVYDVRLISIE